MSKTATESINYWYDIRRFTIQANDKVCYAFLGASQTTITIDNDAAVAVWFSFLYRIFVLCVYKLGTSDDSNNSKNNKNATTQVDISIF